MYLAMAIGFPQLGVRPIYREGNETTYRYTSMLRVLNVESKFQIQAQGIVVVLALATYRRPRDEGGLT